MHAHIDGDILVYRCGFAAEKGSYQLTYEWTEHGSVLNGSETYTYKKEVDARIKELAFENPDDYEVEFVRVLEPVENALYNVKSVIKTILDELSTDEYTVYLSGPDNYRNGIATLKPYKGNRDSAHRPKHGPAIKEYMTERWGAVFSENEEADDRVGYSHYKMYLNDPLSSVIVTTDKDLDMIPGLHYNFVKDEAYNMEDEAALMFFYTQLLTGDSVDNIPGIPKVGKVKAEKLLADTTPEQAWDRIVEAYKKAYGDTWEDALLENGRLLWIRRNPNELWDAAHVVF